MTKKIAIIGAGPGGYVAAIRAAQLKAEVYLVENREIGGTCLNRGCIPTKTYFKNAEFMRDVKRSETFGLKVDNYDIDGNILQARKQEVVDKLVGGIEQLLESYDNIEVINGTAKLTGKKSLSIKLNDGGDKDLEVDSIILATGSEPTMTETKGIDLEGVITSDDLLEMEEIPESLVVIGGGVIGLEFASIYQELGTQVTLLASRILKNMDREIARRLPMFFKKQGMNVYTDIRAKEIEKSGGKLKVTAKYKEKDKEEVVEADYVLAASGRGPVVEGLGLEDVGIEYDRHGIKVNDNYETNIEGIYAIGDVNDDGVQLAHVASAQGTFVVEKILGEEPDVNLNVWPSCVFTLPEVSFVGPTEDELKEQGVEFNSSKFLFAANGKALSLEEGEGFIKVFSSKEDNRLLGVTIMGPHANDLIHEGALAISNGLGIDAIQRTIHAHPTLSESFIEAIDGLDGKAIHMAPPRKRKKRRKRKKK